MLARSRRLLWRDLVWSWEGATVYYRNQLVLCPSILVVVQALPEGSQSSLNLVYVSLDGQLAVLPETYLQLSHCGLAEVLWTRIHAQCDKKAAIDPLFPQTPLALLCPHDALLVQLAGLALCFCLPPRLEGRIAGLRGRAANS
jgi:hypothetical protein